MGKPKTLGLATAAQGSGFIEWEPHTVKLHNSHCVEGFKLQILIFREAIDSFLLRLAMPAWQT
jgi:hypothetical protein